MAQYATTAVWVWFPDNVDGSQWVQTDVRYDEEDDTYRLWAEIVAYSTDPIVVADGEWVLQGPAPRWSERSVWSSWLRWNLVEMLDSDPRLRLDQLLNEYRRVYPDQCNSDQLHEEDYIPDDWERIGL